MVKVRRLFCLLICYILENADYAGVLDNTTYGELIENLGQARRKTEKEGYPSTE